ncbi:MAG: hypothetical protein ACK55Z_13340 [bacterium]
MPRSAHLILSTLLHFSSLFIAPVRNPSSHNASYQTLDWAVLYADQLGPL